MIMGKTEQAWENLFKKYDILRQVSVHGDFCITAGQIREEREVRLMTKFDHSDDRPPIFKKNKLSILPLDRSRFLIGPFECYQDIKDDPNLNPKYMPLDDTFQTLSNSTIHSEQMALAAAYIAGILQDFVGDNTLRQTIDGRLGTEFFSFQINRVPDGTPKTIDVNRAQMEVDAGFEGDSCVVLIEAKMSLEKDFLVRQLFYPYMRWSKRVTKPIKLIYLVYENGLYKLFEYKPTGNNYNGLKFVQQRNYTIRNDKITNDDIEVLLKSPKVPEPRVPFPQADNFERIITILGFLCEKGVATPDEITSDNSFTERQTNYYTTAMRYLGLLNKSKDKKGNGEIVYKLSGPGKEIARLNARDRDLRLANCILSHSVFRKIYELAVEINSIPDKSMIVDAMRESNLYKVDSDSTYFRRASTIASWVRWVRNLVNDCD